MSPFSRVLIWPTRSAFTLTKVGGGRTPPPKNPRPPSGLPPTAASVESKAFAAATTAAGSVAADRKSTRLNSSHSQISYAGFCLKKKNKTEHEEHDTFCVRALSGEGSDRDGYEHVSGCVRTDALTAGDSVDLRRDATGSTGQAVS